MVVPARVVTVEVVDAEVEGEEIFAAHEAVFDGVGEELLLLFLKAGHC